MLSFTFAGSEWEQSRVHSTSNQIVFFPLTNAYRLQSDFRAARTYLHCMYSSSQILCDLNSLHLILFALFHFHIMV